MERKSKYPTRSTDYASQLFQLYIGRWIAKSFGMGGGGFESSYRWLRGVLQRRSHGFVQRAKIL